MGPTIRSSATSTRANTQSRRSARSARGRDRVGQREDGTEDEGHRTRRPMTKWAAATRVVARTRSMASSLIGLRCEPKSSCEEVRAAALRSRGRKISDSIWFMRPCRPVAPARCSPKGAVPPPRQRPRRRTRGWQPGDDGEHRPDARGSVEGVQQRGEVGPERPTDPLSHEIAQDSPANVDERHEGELEHARERAEHVDDHGPHPEGRDGRRVLYDQGLQRLPDPELQRSEGDGSDREAQDDVEPPDDPGDRNPAGRATPSEHRHASPPYCASAQPSLRGSLPHARTPLSRMRISWAPPVGMA